MAISAKYSFPHIEFNSSVIGSIPTQTRWRGTIGVAGQFRRGPQQFLIQDRQTFARLYGEDTSPGAKAVRQMLSLGATDILISRAISEPASGKSGISFYSLTPGVEAKIGYEGQVQQFYLGTPVYTTGLKYTLNYIGEALGNLNAVGRIDVKPNSRLNPDITFEGRADIRLTVEDRVTSTINLVLAAPGLGAPSKSYTTIAGTTYALASTGTLASLNANLTPASTAVAAGEVIQFSSGVRISVTGATYTVVVGGTVAVGEQAFEVKDIPVTNVLARLSAGTKIYHNNAEIATVVIDQEPTNAPVSLKAITVNPATLLASTVLVSQAKIATATVEVTGIANEYKLVRFSSSLYPAFASNLKPGRVLYSGLSTVTFTGGYLTVVGNPTLDPVDSNFYTVLCKGVVTGTGFASMLVSLYDSPVNVYVLSSTLSSSIGSVAYPTATQWRNKYFVQDRSVLVDSFHILPEAYATNAFHLDFLFEDGSNIRDVDSGLIFDVPAVTSAGFVAFLVGSTYQIPIVRATAAVGALAPNEAPFNRGDSASAVLERLQSRILQNALLNQVLLQPVLNDNLTPASLSLETRITGVQANRVYYSLERSTTGEVPLSSVFANDLLFNSDNVTLAQANWNTAAVPRPIYFTGGTEGSRSAYRDYYSTDSDLLVRIVALSEGVYGNKIKISINPIGLGQFSLTAIDEDSISYQTAATTETLSLSTRDVDQTTGVFNATTNSSLIRAYYIPVLTKGSNVLTELELNKVPYRIAPAFGQALPTLNTDASTGNIAKYSPAYQGSSYLQNLYLEGGQDAVADPDAQLGTVGSLAMRKAIQKLEDQDVAIIYPAGVVMGDSRYSSVVEEAIGQINRATTTNGRRRLVLQAPPNLNQDQARLFGAQLNNKDITLVAGHCSVLGISNSNTEHAAAIYAAVLSLSSPQYSPSYLGNGIPISLVRSVDTLSNPQYLEALTVSGVEALIYDASLKTFKFLNGRTTSSVTAEKHVSIRRVADEILNNLYITLQPYRSAPNTAQLRALVAASCDSYLSSLVSEGWIQSYVPTICSLQNNPLATQIQSQLRIRLNYVPIFPADIFLVDVVQSLVEELNIDIAN